MDLFKKDCESYENNSKLKTFSFLTDISFSECGENQFEKVVVSFVSLLNLFRFNVSIYLNLHGSIGTSNFDFRSIQKQPPEVFFKNKFFEKFCKFHKKTAVSESLFIKVADLSPATLSKRDSNTSVFL